MTTKPPPRNPEYNRWCMKCAALWNSSAYAACPHCFPVRRDDSDAAPAPAAPADDLVARLRNTPNWLRQDFGNWKDSTSHYDRAPFEAADVIERLRAEVDRWKKENALMAAHQGIDNYQALIDRAERAEAELAATNSSIKEWGCASCRTVYPGPPQTGFFCVICPKCGGDTMPLEVLKRRDAESDLADERAIVDRIWAIYGTPDYRSLNGKSIYDLIEQDRADLAEARKDAERYRALRKMQSLVARNWIVIGNRNIYTEQELDAAIDKVMAQERK